MGLFRRTVNEFHSELDRPRIGHVATRRLIALGQDLPFVPVRPYEHRSLQLGWRALLLAALVAAAFSRTVSAETLWHDDAIVNDPALRSWAGIWSILSNPLDQSIPPGVRCVNWVVGRAFGIGPLQIRLLLIALHVITAVMAWLTLRRLNVGAAWLSAAVLAVHPAVLPTVGWISQIPHPLGTACAATAIWGYLRARDVRPPLNEAVWTDPSYHSDEESRPVWPWVIFGLAMVSCLASGSLSAVISPLVLLAIELRRSEYCSKTIRALLVAASIVMSASAWWYAGTPTPRRIESMASAGYTIYQSILPLDAPFVGDRSQWPTHWTLAFLFLALAWFFLGLLRSRRAAGLIVWAGLVLAIGHGLLARPVASDAVVRTDILAYPAIVLMVPVTIATGIALIPRRWSAASVLGARWIIGLTLVLGLGTLSVLRSTAFASGDAIWQHTLSLVPNCKRAREELAERYLTQGFVDEAANQLERVTLERRDAHWNVSKARIYEAQKRYIEAADCYEIAHSHEPDDLKILIALAEARANAGQPDQAAALYDRALKEAPTDAGLHTNAGLARLRMGQLQRASDLYEQALKIDPHFLPAHINLANVLFDLGRFEASAHHLQEAVRIDPRNFAAFMNAGILLYRLQDHAKAERMFRAAVNLDSTSPDAFDNLGIVLAAQGKLSDAAWSFTQASRLDPQHAAAAHLTEVRQLLRNQAATQPSR